jgi:hypothetical protein
MPTEVVVLDVQTNTSQAEGSVKSLKSQLKEATIEVQAMADKFGATSKEAIDAAKRAADLKDRIGDAKSLVDAFNPDAKFKAFSASLQGVAGGFAAVQGAMGLMGAETQDVEKMLLKVQSAMALSQGLNALGEAGDAFKTLGKQAVEAFKQIRTAIGSTGIGLLVVALGTIYAYWDDIKEAVSGVSEETKKAADEAQKKLSISEQELKAVDDTSNILKLQGKTEKDILKIKNDKIKASIEDAKVNIATQEQITKAQLESEKRNYNILKNIVRFGIEANVAALRIISAPLDALIVTANKIAETLGFSKIVSTTINEEISKLTSKGAETISKLVFDPEKVETEGKKTVEEAKSKLQQLQNQQAGFELEINKIDADANKKKKEESDKSAQELLEANKKANEDILKLQQENTIARIADDRKRAEAKLEFDLEASKKDVENSKASAEIKAKQIQALEEKYMLDLNALKEKNRLEDEKKAKENLDKQLKAEEDTFDAANQLRIAKIKDQNIKRQELEADRYQKETDALYLALNNKQIAEDEFNAKMALAKFNHETNLTAIEKEASDERQKNAQTEHNLRVSLAQEIGNVLGELGNVVGQQTAFGKSMALAQIAIDTGVAIASLTRNSEANPSNALTGGISGAIQFATGIARILANIAKAKQLLSQAKVPGGGGGGGGTPNIPTAAPIAPQMSQTALNQQLVNQTGNATTRAFVLETDVSGNQERIRRLNRAARIN